MPGLGRGMQPMARYSQEDRELLQAMESLLYGLSGKQHEVLRMRYGLDGRGQHSQKALAEKWGIRVSDVRAYEDKALARLRHNPKYTGVVPTDSEWIGDPAQDRERAIQLSDIIASVNKLTPELIAHLRSHDDHLERIHWQVFEHLVAEFFSSWGFEDVAIVGRNSRTSADIFAAYRIPSIGERIRYFIEVKRWKEKVGVEVIDRVYGAMLFERPLHGWHAAMIVSAVGFTEFEKYKRQELARRGIMLREREDLLRWLKDYQPNKSGLWLPNPSATIAA